MSDLKLLAALRKFKPNLKVEDYLNGENRQNLKAIEDGFRRTHKAMNSANDDISSLQNSITALNTLNYEEGSNSGAYAPGGNAEENITNANVTITTTGKRIRIGWKGNGLNLARFGATTATSAQIRCYRKNNETGVETLLDYYGVNALLPPSALSFLDTGIYGTSANCTYRITVTNGVLAGFGASYVTTFAEEY